VSDDKSLAATTDDLVTGLVAGNESAPRFDARGSQAMSRVLLGQRRNAVRRAVPPIPRQLGAEFGARFDEFARVKRLSRKQTAVSDAIAFLGWLRRNGALPTELRFLAVKLRWQRMLRR
jgi:hypothetical protein